VKALLQARREIVLEVNTEKSKQLCLATEMQDKIVIYQLLINSLKMWQSSNLGTKIANQNYLHKRLNMENACYHSVQSLLISSQET
jgi:hypothetical protein